MTTLELQSPPESGVPLDAAALLRQGNVRFNSGDLEGALEDYRAALAKHPTFTEALNNEGAVLGKMGRHREALHAFRRSLEIEPTDAVTLGNVGLVYTHLNEAESALDYFGQSLALEKSHRTLNNRGTLLTRLDRLEDALADFDSSLEIEPQDDVARFNRSGVLLAMNRPQEAFRDIEAIQDRMADGAEVIQRRHKILDACLRELVEAGFATWSGERAHGTRSPVPVTGRPPVSDYVAEDRR
jgi:tetratricopeptide (TPR) repeat protein